MPLSLFKVWPFANCGTGDNDRFEVCPTDINSRKVRRKILADGAYPITLPLPCQRAVLLWSGFTAAEDIGMSADGA